MSKGHQEGKGTTEMTHIPASMTDKFSDTLNKLAASYERKGYTEDQATAKALQDFHKIMKGGK